MIPYDTIVVGGGASGMMAAITAAWHGQKVLVLEKLRHPGAKLKASGGGRCNLSNTLSNEDFMDKFGKQGHFMRHALDLFDHHALRDFMTRIGVETDIPDGFRIFPVGHDARVILDAMSSQMHRAGVELLTDHRVTSITHSQGAFQTECIPGHATKPIRFLSKRLIIATGGKGYPKLGSEGDGYSLAQALGHTTTQIFPAMMPLWTAETWPALCRADTIPKAHIIVDIKKYRKLQATGDLIFTKRGIRGPVVLDFAREITPLLNQMDKVPILINMTKGMNAEEIRTHIKQKLRETTRYTTVELISTLLPRSLSQVICTLADADPLAGFGKQPGPTREKIIQLLAWVPMTIVGHDGFDQAMVTRGGIKLQEIDDKTMQSKIVKGLYFCGEVVDLDGPCGGYNLQWAFSSGYLAGSSI